MTHSDTHAWVIAAMRRMVPGKHEDGSEVMFDYLVQDNNIPIPMKDQQFIKALIAGDHSRT